MSNLLTSTESRDAGEPSWADHDRDHHVQTNQETSGEETAVETPHVDAKESGAIPSSPSLGAPKRPRSLALAEVAANAVHAAWEAGYAQGFSAGRSAGLGFATALHEAPTGQVRHIKLTYDPGKNSDGSPKPF